MPRRSTRNCQYLETREERMAFIASVRAKIEKAGGRVEVVHRTNYRKGWKGYQGAPDYQDWQEMTACVTLIDTKGRKYDFTLLINCVNKDGTDHEIYGQNVATCQYTFPVESCLRGCGKRRQKTVFADDYEVARVWVTQSQPEGRNRHKGNCYFTGPTIYSYGSHFPMARFVTPTLVLKTTQRYSNTTNRHQSSVSSALLSRPEIKVLRCENVMAKDVYGHVANVQAWRKTIEGYADRQLAARKTDYTEGVVSQLQQLNSYVEYFKLGSKYKKLEKALLGLVRCDQPNGKAIMELLLLDACKRRDQKKRKAAKDARALLKRQRENEKLVKRLQPMFEAAFYASETEVKDGDKTYRLASLAEYMPELLRLSADGTECISSRHPGRHNIADICEAQEELIALEVAKGALERRISAYFREGQLFTRSVCCCSLDRVQVEALLRSLGEPVIARLRQARQAQTEEERQADIRRRAEELRLRQEMKDEAEKEAQAIALGLNDQQLEKLVPFYRVSNTPAKRKLIRMNRGRI